MYRHSPAHRARPALLIGLLAPLAAASACGTITANATRGPDQDGAIGGRDASSELVLLPDGAPAFCQGSGPAIALPDGTCTGDIGKRTFLFAVCSCTSIQISGTLKTDSLDSTQGLSSGNGASIGTNGSLDTVSDMFLQGSVFAGGVGVGAGAPVVRFQELGTIKRDLHSAGLIATNQGFKVDGDVFAGGDVTGPLTCGGAAHVAPGPTAAGVTAKKGIVTEAVSVPPPCDCAKPLDVKGIIAAFATTNDDAALGVTPEQLASATATPLTLPCGRYFFSAIGGDRVSLSLAGRTAIFVAGDLRVQGALAIDLAPGAELDLFVGGNLILGDATLGSTTAPAHVRVYVGGTTVTLSGNAKLGANLYALNADVALSSDFEMAGALFVKSLALSGTFSIHYDEAILGAEGCDSQQHGCATCHDCAGATPACKGGACVPCVTTADCCAPLLCSSGRCVPDIR
jgi:hypothetical protein